MTKTEAKRLILDILARSNDGFAQTIAEVLEAEAAEHQSYYGNRLGAAARAAIEAAAEMKQVCAGKAPTLAALFVSE